MYHVGLVFLVIETEVYITYANSCTKADTDKCNNHDPQHNHRHASALGRSYICNHLVVGGIATLP